VLRYTSDLTSQGHTDSLIRGHLYMIAKCKLHNGNGINSNC